MWKTCDAVKGRGAALPYRMGFIFVGGEATSTPAFRQFHDGLLPIDIQVPRFRQEKFIQEAERQIVLGKRLC